MATYTVQYQVTIVVEVEADSDAEAREEAYDVMSDMLDNNDSIGWSTDSDDPVVQCIADDDDDDDDTSAA